MKKIENEDIRKLKVTPRVDVRTGNSHTGYFGKNFSKESWGVSTWYVFHNKGFRVIYHFRRKRNGFKKGLWNVTGMYFEEPNKRTFIHSYDFGYDEIMDVVKGFPHITLNTLKTLKITNHYDYEFECEKVK